MQELRHMTLSEYDKKIAPLLGAIKGRARWLVIDAHQIKDWVKQLVAAPNFDTEAFAVMIEAKEALSEAESSVNEAIASYNQKEKVT